MAIGAIAPAAATRIAPPDRGPPEPGEAAGPLDRLLARPSPLDRLVADAGALGKFRTDQPDALPAGTSSFTRRAVDTTDAVAARLCLPRERAWSAMAMPAGQDAPAAPAVADAPGSDRALDINAVFTARPAVATDAGNRLFGGVAGNLGAARA